MSAASFLGLIGLIALQGMDGVLYSVGGFVAFVTILLLMAEPLRNLGKYTVGDVLAYRFNPRPVRAAGGRRQGDEWRRPLMCRISP